MKLTISVKDDICQHFWHFVMGEFLPIIHILQDKLPDEVYLYNSKRSWNSPFDKFYQELDFNISFVNSKPTDTDVLHYKKWDFSWTPDDYQKCLKAVTYLKNLVINRGYHIDNSNHTLVHYRSCNDELKKYFKKAFKHQKFGSKEYGSDKRAVKNMDKISDYLDNVLLLNTDNQPILEQISHYINKDKLILEHGAGMFFVLFMNKNSKILEIKTKSSKNKNGAVDGLLRIGEIKNDTVKRLIVRNNSCISNYKKELINISKSLFEV